MPPEMPRLEDLELFVAVTDTGGVSAAARLLGYTQPTASRMLARCERQLGRQLLIRTPNGSHLTSDGELVAEWARRIVAMSVEMLDAVTALGRTSAISIVASQTIAEAKLPIWLGLVRSTVTGLDLSIEVNNSRAVIDLVTAGKADLGFIENFDAVALPSTVVAHDRLIVRAPVGHPWVERGVVTAAELAREPLVTREAGSGTRDALARLVAGRELAAPALSLHSNAAVRLAVVNGVAPAALSEFAWDGLDAKGRAATVEVAVETADAATGLRELRAIWRDDSPQRALIAEIVGAIASAHGSGASAAG